MEFPVRLLRIMAVALAVTLLAAACGDDGGDANRIDLGENGLTPSIDDIQGDITEGSTLGLEFVTFDGEPVSFERYLGRPLVINFFAQWCVNCVQEMPEFEEVSHEFEDTVTFVGISIDDTPEDARELIDITGVTYDVGWDPSEEIYTHFQGLSMPTTVFVDADGNVARVWSGVLDADSLRDRITEDLL